MTQSDTVAFSIKMFEQQQRSADLWISEWQKHRDAPSAKNALFALGKVAGAFNALLVSHRDNDLPEHILQQNAKNSNLFDEIMNTPMRVWDQS